MKNLRLLILVLALFTTNSFAQTPVDYSQYAEAMQASQPKVQEIDGKLVLKFVDKEWSVQKGDTILINLPLYGNDNFLFIQKKKGWLNAKLVGAVAQVVASGAVIVGLNANSFDTLLSAIKVSETASSIGYGADALDRISDLTISKKAKKIAGKRAIVTGWKIKDGEYYVFVKIGKKKYEINYISAVITQEVILPNHKKTEEE